MSNSKQPSRVNQLMSNSKQVGGHFKMVRTGKTVCSPLGCFDEFDAVSMNPTKKQSKKNKTNKRLFL
jgi:hypothetical protein